MHRRLTFWGAPLFLAAAVLFFPIVGFSQQTGDQPQGQAEPPVLLRTIRRGSAGDDVRRLQIFLSQFPEIYPEGLATGFFGPATERSVRRFQEQNGLPSVGIVGPMTRERLSQRSERAERINVVTESLRRGRSGENVRRVQEFLAMFPDIYPERQVTGNFGPATESAVRRFQEIGGRPVTGEVDTGTQELINRLTVEGARQKPPRIQNVSPTSGPSGITVTVTGKGFTPENNAIFVRGKTIVSGLRSDDGGTSITFVLPSNVPCTANPPKACPIKVINQNGISNARPFKLINLPEAPAPEPEPEPAPTPTPEPPPEPTPAAPTITNLLPAQGPVGTKVTIEGSGFTATGNSVNFGGVSNAVTGVASTDGKKLIFTVLQTPCAVGSVCSVSVTNANGTSNVAAFLLTQVITPIKVVVPNGGELFLQGVQNAIRWTGGTDRVQILLVNASTTNNVDPTAEIIGWIATSTTPDGSVMWDPRKVCNVENTLCSEVTPGQYKILALSEDELGALTIWDDIQNKAGNWDVSDSPFTVLERSAVLVTVPNWGGVYTTGQYLVVCWYSYNLTSKKVVVVLVKGDQVIYSKTITQGFETGVFEGGFYIPTDAPVGSDYKILVYDAASPTNPALRDESDAPFTIVNSSSYIDLKSPNGGETWTAGFKGNVRWQSVNITSKSLNINLLKGGVFYRALATNLPQGYTWSTATYTSGTFDRNIDIPADITTGNDYTLEITDAVNPLVRDISNQPFTVVKLPDTINIRAKFIDYKTRQALANQSVWVWDGATNRQVLTSSAGDLLLTANVADIVARNYINFYTYPTCYGSKSFFVSANLYGLYGYQYLFPLIGGPQRIQVAGDADFGDAPFWQVTDVRFLSDTPSKLSLYYRNSATGQGWQTLWPYTVTGSTVLTFGQVLPLEADAWAKLEDLSGQISYSPFVNVPWGHCTAKTLTQFDRSIKWEPYQVTATATFSPTFLKISNMVSGNITASGGTSPYTFSIASGSLPPGVTLSNTGILSGTTTQTGIYDAMVRVQDVKGTNGAITLHMEVRKSDGTLPPYIRVYYPYAGNQWYQGQSVYIGWYSYNIAGKSVKVELLKGGSLYRTITTFSQTYPSGYYYYLWTVPSDLPGGADYAVRVSDASDASIVSGSSPFWIVNQGSGALWYAWSSKNVTQHLYFKYPSSNISGVTTFKVYQKKPGETASNLVASCSSPAYYYYSYCTTTTSMLASGYWYLYYYSWSGQMQLYGSYYSQSGFSPATFPKGTYEYTITTVDSSGVESAPVATLKTNVLESIAVTSPNVTESPIATPFNIRWSIPTDFPQAAERSFGVSVGEKTAVYYTYPWVAQAGPFSGFDTSGYRLYEGPNLDPAKTYQASVWSTPSILDPNTGIRTGYLGISNLPSFWVRP